jgi:dihydroxyacetone kinase
VPDAGGGPDVGVASVGEDRSAIVRDAIVAMVRALMEGESELTKLDSAVGDGDLGISLSRGANAVVRALDRYDLHRPALLLSQISETLRRSLGGTSGPLYSACLSRMSAHLPRVDWPSSSQWALAFAAGCKAVSDLGGAQPGERTMLDAMEPAAQALCVGTQAGLPACEVLTMALRAAEQGCEATKSMAPRRGRSSYLGERALGSPDPGAHAVTIWLRALRQAMTERHNVADS